MWIKQVILCPYTLCTLSLAIHSSIEAEVLNDPNSSETQL